MVRAALVAASAFLLAAPAWAGLEQDCNADLEPQGRIEGCTKHIDGGALTESELATAYGTRAGAFVETVQYEAATEDLDRAIDLDATRAEYFELRAALRAEAGQYASAIEDVDRAIALEPKAYRPLINRCSWLTELGRNREAMADCERALEIEWRAYWAYNNTAWTLYRIGLLREALSDVSVALSVEPDNWAILDMRAHILLALGEGEAALADLLAAMSDGGAYVVELCQGALREHGFYSGDVDGVLTDKTKAALEACAAQGCALLSEPGTLPEREEGEEPGLFDPVYLCLAEHGLAEDATFLTSATRSVLIGSDGGHLTVLDAGDEDRLVVARTARGLFDLRLKTAATEALEACFDKAQSAVSEPEAAPSRAPQRSSSASTGPVSGRSSRARSRFRARERRLATVPGGRPVSAASSAMVPSPSAARVRSCPWSGGSAESAASTSRQAIRSGAMPGVASGAAASAGARRGGRRARLRSVVIR
jgi:tetratricopeptide (TPR) repeat protein